MTVEEVNERVAEIERIVRDPEAAHVYEDQLWHDVLFEIAAGVPSAHASNLAVAALQTESLKFPRWCA